MGTAAVKEAPMREGSGREIGKSAYYVRDGSTVCRGKILSEGAGPSYRLKGANGSIMWYKLFDTADEARATIVPQRWWRGNNEH